MSDVEISKDELIRRIDAGYKALQALLSQWTDEQMVTPGGPDGWSVKDHLAHIATWQRGQAALLRREDRWQAMGVDLDFAVNASSVEEINDRYYEQTRNKSLSEVRGMLFDSHQQLLKALEDLNENDIYLPHSDFQPEEPNEGDDRPLWQWLSHVSYEHYEEHTLWMMEVIVNPDVNKAEMLHRVDAGYKALQEWLSKWTDDQIVTPGGPDGWSIKDHLAHIAAWERGHAAFLRGENRWEATGIDPDFAMNATTDEINARYYEQAHDKLLAEVRSALADAHQQLLDALDAVTDADLLRPSSYFQPDQLDVDEDLPTWQEFANDSYEHYKKHIPWMKEVIVSNIEVTTAEMLRRMDASYKSLQQLLGTWTDEQMVTPGGPDGWSVKDHLAHIAAWERGQSAIMRRENRWSAMGLSADTGSKNEDINELNNEIREHSRNRSLADVRADVEDAHQQLVIAIQSLTDTDLLKTYSYYQPEEPGEDDGRPIWPWIVGNSYGHYEEHEPWMKEVIANPIKS